MSQKINRLNWKLIPPLILSFMGIALIILVTSKYGPALSHDSAAYIFAAETLAKGKGFIYFGYNTPFIQWPPGLSAVLALPYIMGLDLVSASRYINSAAFGMLIFLSSLWMLRSLKNYAFVSLGLLAVILSTPLISIFSYVWSEPLFIVCIMVFLITFEKYLLSGNRTFLVLAAAFACFACLLRYMGTAAVFTAVLFLIFQKKDMKSKLTDTIIFGLMSVIPFCAWLVRNYMVFSTFTGVREPSQVSFVYNIGLSADTLLSWLLPFYQSPGALISMLFGLVFVILVICLFGEIKDNIAVVLMFTFSFIYTMYLVISASISALDPIGSRLLSPVYVPVMLMVFFAVDRVCFKFPAKPWRRLATGIVIVLVSLWVVYPSVPFVRVVNHMTVNGAGGYSDVEWANSDLVEYVNKVPAECTIYSNYPDVIYLLAGRQALYLPKKSTPVYEYGLEKFKASVDESSCSYILWYDRGQQGWFYNIEEISQYFSVEKISKAGDGIVYRIK